MRSTTSKCDEKCALPLAVRNHMVLEELPHVRHVARAIHIRLSGRVPLEDLVNMGVIGLIDALSKFDPRRKIELRSYARHRIRGAILDGLREQDWGPRWLRRQGRQIEEAKSRLQARLGRDPTLAEIASAMGISEIEVHRIARDLHGLELASLQERQAETGGRLEEALEDRSARSPFDKCQQEEMMTIVRRAMSRLPRRMRQVMDLYYFRGLSMPEIGARIGVSESRVSQIHSQAIRALRSNLRDALASRVEA